MSYDPRPYDMRPAISGQKPMQIAPSGPNINPPFGPAKSWIAGRANLPANGKGQLVQNTLACQKVVIINDGGGDLIVGPSGLSLNAPALGTETPGGNVAVGAGVVIEIEDASLIWAGSNAGTFVTYYIMGLPNVKRPGD
jgi:hypothetical protein